MFDDLPEFKLDDLDQLWETPPQAGKHPGASLEAPLLHRRQSPKRKHMHALEVRNAARYLAELPEPGEAIHGIMNGTFHAWDFVPAVLDLAGCEADYLGVATLGFNRQNAAELLELIDAGRIRRCDFLCSTYYRNNEPDVYTGLAAELTKRGSRCACVRTHAKVLLWRLADGRGLVMESSANLRSCNAVEQFALTDDPDLLAFHAQWMDELIRKAAA